MSNEKEKVVTTEIALDADADTVWRALTEGEEIARWFPPDARVEPGVGGNVWLSWGEGMEWAAPIEVWEPRKHLRTTDPPPSRLAVDYYIESRGGETVLRLVHSGFGADAWDDEIDTMTTGWRAFFANLRFYLSRHRGEPRTLASFRHPIVKLPREEVFPRMLRVLGLPENSHVDQSIDAATRTGDRLTGVVDVFGPPINFSASLEQWNGSFLIIEIEPGRGQCRPAFWLSLYGDAGGEAAAIEARWRAAVEQEFA